jgi:CRISPR-associated protein Cas1
MLAERSALRDGVVVAHGYGLRVYVERGHLIVEDGVGRQRQRRRRRLNRGSSQLRRLVLTGHTGYVTLEALRWIRDVGASFVQLDDDGSPVTVSGGRDRRDAWIRRAQVAAADNGAGVTAMRRLVIAKLEGQARVVERLADLKPTVLKRGGRTATPAETILSKIPAIQAAESYPEIRQPESHAGVVYWGAWAHLPVPLGRWWDDRAPDHWRFAGPRSSPAGGGKPRRAITPVHALLNYAYGILATEATIAARELALDPTIGMMHTTRRLERDLISDLIEPARPVADQLVLDLLRSRELGRGDIHETRDGRCRLGPPLIRLLALEAPRLYEAVQPVAFEVLGAVLVGDGRRAPIKLRRMRKRAG